MIRINKFLSAVTVICLCLISAGFITNRMTIPPDVIPMKVLWKFNLAEHNSTQPIPVFDKGTIYIYNNQGKLFALDSKKGVKKWEFKSSGKIYSPPSVFNDIIYVASYDGTLYSLYTSNARTKWTARTFTELAATPYVFDGKEVYIIKKNKILGYDLETGLDLWKKDCNVMNYKDIYKYPDFLLFTDGNRFVAEKVKNCETVWDYAPGNMRVDYYQTTKDNVVLSTAKTLFIINVNDGKEVWKHNTNPKEILMKGPLFIIYEDEIFVAVKNQVMIYDMTSGGLKKTFKNKEEIKRIVVTENKMLLFNELDEVYLINRADYKKGEKYIINEKINSELYYFNKQLYFINLEDNLVSVAIPE
jgi:outer membrane protein assembly factor BamB